MFKLFKKTHSNVDPVDIKESPSYSESQKIKHQKDKNDLMEYFHRGVDYSPKELEALNKFLDGVALNGYKFYHSCYGNMIMTQEVTGWQQKLALPINYDRHKQQMGVDKDYTDLSYDCAMTYSVVQPLIEQFNKDVRGEQIVNEHKLQEPDLQYAMFLVKTLIDAHLDFYDYNNDCDYRVGDITEEEWKPYTRALEDCRDIIDFAFDKKQWSKEDEKLNDNQI